MIPKIVNVTEIFIKIPKILLIFYSFYSQTYPWLQMINQEGFLKTNLM